MQPNKKINPDSLGEQSSTHLTAGNVVFTRDSPEQSSLRFFIVEFCLKIQNPYGHIILSIMCVAIQMKTIYLNVKSEILMVILLCLLCIMSDVLHGVKCVEHKRDMR